MTYPLILRLDATGLPVKWLPWQHAVCLYAQEKVVWTAGSDVMTLHGGRSRTTGLRSSIKINSIIAVKGENRQLRKRHIPPLSNRELFRRDEHLCLYCGREFNADNLTRDHVIPISRGGRDHWANVVSACKRCNTHKGGRSPEQSGMPLLAIPYVPNHAEYLVLGNRKILADQMQFLKTQFKNIDRQWKI